jgi:flagellar export protein FliJ
MKARQCWTVLADKAESECGRIQQELTNLSQRLEGLQANERRLRVLYTEYHERLTRPGAESSGMQDAIGQRQFMQQIDALIEQVLRDQQVTRQALALTRQQLTDAQREKLKMQSLVEQDLNQQRTAARLLDQKTMDDLALRQFNLRQQLHGHA